MSRLIDPFEQFFDLSGKVLAGGKLYFYETGSSSAAKSTFSDPGFTVENTNPVILEGDGRCPDVFGPGSYRVELKDKDDVLILTRDPVGGVGSTGFGADWLADQSYSKGDVVRDDGEYWFSLTDNNINHKPSTDDGTNWEKAVVSQASVQQALEQVVNNFPALSVSETKSNTGQIPIGALGISDIELDNRSAWDGRFYNIPEDGNYRVTGSIFIGTADGPNFPGMIVQASGSNSAVSNMSLAPGVGSNNQSFGFGQFIARLEAGDTVQIKRQSSVPSESNVSNFRLSLCINRV